MSFRRITTPGLAALLAVAVLGSARPVQAGSLTFEINVDFSAAGLAPGPGGFVDLTLNPAFPPPPASLVSATVYGATMDAGTSVGGQVYQEGDTSGLLPGPVSMDNNGPTGNNELTQDLTLGGPAPTGFFDIFVTLTGPEIGSLAPFSGTTFALSVYDGNDGVAIGQLLVNPDGTVTSGSLTSVGVTITQVVPEPSSVVLLGAGLGGLVVVGRWRKARAAA